MPRGTRILVGLLTLLVGAGVVYYGFIMAPPERSSLEHAVADRGGSADAAEPFRAPAPDREGAAASPSVTAAAPPDDARQVVRPRNREESQDRPRREESNPGAAQTPPADGRDAHMPDDRATARATGARSSRPLGIADPAGIVSRAAADPVRSARPDLPDGRSGSSSPRAADEPPRATPRAPETGSSSRATDPAHERAPSAPRANEPLRIREAERARSAPAAGSPPQGALARAQEHVVASGETLSAIALKYYGSANAWSILADANPGIDPDRLQIGQRLRVPPVAPRNAATESHQGRATIRRVASGDTLSSISEWAYGTPNHWKRIYDANRDVIGSDPGRLRVGMSLRIPPATDER